MNKNLYAEIHVLQTFPVSNINRDDVGMPKTAPYGGVERARISSQSQKYAMRQNFMNISQDEPWLAGIRSRKLPLLVAQAMINKKSDMDLDKAKKISHDLFDKMGFRFDKISKDDLAALFLVSKAQIDKLAEFLLNHQDLEKTNKTAFKKIKDEVLADFNEDNSLDLAMFGRMAAGTTELNVDGAVQVAHALSTHKVQLQYDFFNAIDDAKDSKGAAMLDTNEFDSATFYRYANVNIHQLIHNLGSKEAAIEGTRLFFDQFINTIPTGKQNSYANVTVPQYVLIVIRSDRPINLVSAFEEPVKSKDGFVKPSISKLEDEYQRTSIMVEPSVYTAVLTAEKNKLGKECTQAKNKEDLLNSVTEEIEKSLQNDENDHAKA